ILATAFDGSAQEATQLRRLPAQLAPAQAAPVKPSRPQPAQVKRGPAGPSAPGTFAAGNAAGGSTPSQLANLVVVPYYTNQNSLPEGFPTHSYCLKNPAGGTPTNIRFYIRNVGGSASGGFQWTPSFPNAGAAPAHVLPSIPAGGQVTITQPIPNGCYTPGFSGVCQFSIHLDDHDEVAESSEANTWQSHCVSPAG
ncbi:MAG TPA: hypothetical protein VKP12_11400, partial [Kiloniellaceae bacterium]|nr:hypothetical protein [Kiloniellaceae bacterium]